MVEGNVPSQDAETVVVPPSPPRRVWPTALFGLIMLVSGAACGVGLTLLLTRTGEEKQDPRQETHPPLSRRIAARIAKTCKLTDEQVKQVEAIAERYQKAARSVRAEFMDKMGAEFETFRNEIKAVMTPEQFQAFDEHWKRLRSPRRDYRRNNRREHGRLLPRLDANKDGKLTQDEVPAAMWQRLSKADTNGDGGVDQKELNALRLAPVPPAETSAPAGAENEAKP